MDRFPEFLERIVDEPGLSAGSFQWIEGSDLPLPYRDLLVHKKDMTSTLANFHHSKICLEVLKARTDGGAYVREVVLFAESTGNPVEYGAIRIQLDRFQADERDAIVGGKEPLGSILNRMHCVYHSRPRGFFSIQAPVVCQKRFGCDEGETLYGRYNQLVNGEEEELASIIEILPLAGKAEGQTIET